MPTGFDKFIEKMGGEKDSVINIAEPSPKEERPETEQVPAPKAAAETKTARNPSEKPKKKPVREESKQDEENVKEGKEFVGFWMEPSLKEEFDEYCFRHRKDKDGKKIFKSDFISLAIKEYMKKH